MAQAPVVALVSRSAPARLAEQPLTVCTKKTVPLKVFSLEILEILLERRNAQAEWTGGIFGTQFHQIDDFGIKPQIADQPLRSAGGGRKRKCGSLQRRTVEVEAASLITARIAGIEHQVIIGLVRQDSGAAEFIFALAVGDRHAVKLCGRIALTRQADYAANSCRQRGRKQRCQRGLVCGADGVVVGEGRVEPFAFVGVTQTQGQIELVSDMDNIVGEQCPVAAALVIPVDRRTNIVHAVEAHDRSPNRWRCCTESRRLRSRAARRRWRIKPSKATARNDAAGCKSSILATKAQIVAKGQLFIGKEAADEPVELAVKGLSLQTQFLTEGLELAVSIIAGCAIQDIDRAIVGVRPWPLRYLR